MTQEENFALFQKWFRYECHTILVDTVDAPILDDEDEGENIYH